MTSLITKHSNSIVHLTKTLERDTAGRDGPSGSLDEVRDLELLLHDHPVAASAGVCVVN